MIRLISVFLLSAISTVLLTACVPENLDVTVDEVIENGGAYEAEIKRSTNKYNDKSKEILVENDKETLGGNKEIVGEKSKENNLKVLSTYKINAEVILLDSFLEDMIKKVHKFNGYVSKKEITRIESSEEREASISIKVPKENLEDLISFLKDELSIRSESLYTLDITEDYDEFDERIKLLEEKEKRLLSLYDKIKDISEVIEIDDKITLLNEEKQEILKKQIKIDNGSKLSNVDIFLKEVKKYTNRSENESPPKDRLKESLSSMKDNFIHISLEMMLFLIKVFPVLVFVSILSYLFRDKIKKQIMDSKEKPKKEKE